MRILTTSRILSGLLALQLLLPAAALAAADDLYQQGVQLFQAGQFAASIEKMAAYATQVPRQAEPHYYLGLANYSLKRFDEALAQLQRAKELEPRLAADIDYSIGAVYYQQGQVEQARAIFQRLAAATDRADVAARAREFLTAMENAPAGEAVDPHLQAGIAAYEQKNYELAMSELDQALKAQPESVPAQFYTGAVLYDTQRFNDALPHFRRVMSLSPVTEWGASAQAYLESIQQASGAPARDWSLSLGTTGLYDENVVGVNPTSSTASNTSSAVSYFFLSGGYRPTNWFGVNYSFNQSVNYSSSSYNYQDHLGSLYFAYADDARWTPALQYVFDYALLGGSQYQTMHRVSPNVTWRMGSGFESQLYYAYDFKNFPSYAELTGNAHELGLGGRWTSGAFSVGLRYGLHMEQAANLSVSGSPVPTYFSYSYTGHQISADAVLPLVEQIYVLLGAGYDFRRYNDPDRWLTSDSAGNTVLNTKRRVDNFLNFSVGFTRRLTPNLGATLQYAFNRSISSLGSTDYTDYNYNRQTVSLTLQADL